MAARFFSAGDTLQAPVGRPTVCVIFDTGAELLIGFFDEISKYLQFLFFQ